MFEFKVYIIHFILHMYFITYSGMLRCLIQPINWKKNFMLLYASMDKILKVDLELWDQSVLQESHIIGQSG